MSVLRVKTIFENLANRNITNQQMRDMVLDYISDSATGTALDTTGWTNEQIAEEFLIQLRAHIKTRVSLGAGKRHDDGQEAAREQEIADATANLEEFDG